MGKFARFRRTALFCALLALPACSSWLLGADDADDDGVATKADAGGPARGADGGHVVVPVDDAGQCQAPLARCGDVCVSAADPAYGCGAASCAACAGPSAGGAAVCRSGACDISCASGYKREGNDCLKDIFVPAGQIGLLVEQARQTSGEPLQLAVTLKNGESGAPLALDPALLQVTTAAGLQYPGQSGAGARWWVDGTAPATGASLAAGASLRWRVQFAGIKRGDSAPVSVRFATPEAPPRVATANITLEPCTPCGAACTYTDRDITNCGACGVDVTGGSCAGGTPTCPAGKDLCGSACYNLRTDANHCGSCSAPACSAPANGNSPSCRAGTCDFACNTGYAKQGNTCIATTPPQWRAVASGSIQTLQKVWGSSPSNIWAVGAYGTLLRWNGSSWASVSSSVSGHFNSVWGSSANDIWVTGSGYTVIRWTGATWDSVAFPTGRMLTAVWGSSANNVWGVGYTNFYRWNGASWTTVRSDATSELNAIWGSSANDIWAVGALGEMWRRDASDWNLVASNTTSDLYALWGSGPRDVWTAGANGTVLRWNGASWASVPCPFNHHLLGIWGTGPSDIWAVGYNGTILHWDGSAWSSAASPTRNHLLGIWGTGRSDIWAVGSNGTILHYSP